MKTLAMIAAAGSLAAFSAPATAAEMTLDSNVAFAPAHTPTPILTLDMVAAFDGPRYRYDDDDDWDDDDDDYYERRRDRRCGYATATGLIAWSYPLT